MDEKQFENLSEEQILQRLLDADHVPERTVILDRIQVPVQLKAITAKQLYAIREEHTARKENKKRGTVTETLDTEGFYVGLVLASVVSPNFGDQKLLAKFKASGPDEVIKRLLLAGELEQLADHVLEVSGFNTELEEIKN